MMIRFTKKMRAADSAYKKGQPVVIEAIDGSILHGEATLKRMVEYELPLTCKLITGVDRAAFEASKWPKILEAARRAFWKKMTN